MKMPPDERIAQKSPTQARPNEPIGSYDHSGKPLTPLAAEPTGKPPARFGTAPNAKTLLQLAMRGEKICYECGVRLAEGEKYAALGRYLYCLGCVEESICEV